MASQTAISTWICEDNLKAFLDRLSSFIGYRFEDWDWDAIRFGVRDTKGQQHWYEYALSGNPSVKLALASSNDDERILVKAETEPMASARMEALASIMQVFDTRSNGQEFRRLVETAFSETTCPGENHIVGCDAAHLVCCLECQETLDYFRGKHWSELLEGEDILPCYYGGLSFLTPEARWFFFPAYLSMTLRSRDAEWLEIALEATGKHGSFTVLQRELIEFALQLAGDEA